ncbi:MAG: YciI family protein [Gemmatimonadales bacterium]
MNDASSPDPLADLDRHASPSTPPPLLKARVMTSLRERGLIRAAAGRTWRWAVPASLVAAVVVFAAGFQVGRRSAPPERAVTLTPQFVLFLYEDAGFHLGRDPRESVAEYGAWGRRIRRQGRYLDGQKLFDSTRQLAAVDGEIRVASSELPGPAGRLGGYFIIGARDYDEAVAVAKTHPHLKYGGRIVIREIEPT